MTIQTIDRPTKTIKINLYGFDDLSETAKARARQDYLAGGDLWPWAGEWWASAVAFSEIAPIKVLAIDWDRAEPDMRFDDSDIAGLTGVRAWKWLQNHGWFDLAARNAQGGCTLTGYCGDCDFFGPIEAARRDPSDIATLEDLFCDCIYSWARAARRDLEHAYSEEAADDWLRESETLFLRSGKIWA